MSRAQRIALLGLAAAVAVAALVLINPSDESGRGPSSEPARKPEPGAVGGTAGAEGAADRTGTRATRVTVRRGKPLGGVRMIRIRSGETVRLSVSADSTDEVHVHGYDLLEPVRPGRPAHLRFTARLEGVFDVELEDARLLIARLRVEP